MPKVPHIDSAFFGSFIIDGKRYDCDVVISWKGEVHERKKTHEFTKAELLGVLMAEPEVVVVGTGHSGVVKVESGVEVAARLEGVELIIKQTPEAVQEYNKLARAKKKVVAVLHSTC